MAKTLRETVDARFTTKNAALIPAEFDTNWIEFMDEIDSINAAITAISTPHTQNSDTLLDEGNANEVSAADLRVLLDDIPVPTTGDSGKKLFVNGDENGYELLEYGYGYFHYDDNATETTIGASDTATDISLAGAMSAPTTQNFSAGGGLQVDWDGTTNVKIDAVFTAFVKNAEVGTVDIEIVPEVDGSPQPGIAKARIDDNGGFISWSGIVSMNNNSSFLPRCKNLTNSANLIFEQIQIKVKSIN